MQLKNLIVVLVSITLGFVAGFVCRPDFIEMAVDDGTETEMLSFESDVTSYTYSESGVIGIKKIDDRNYEITAVNPGMCVISFATAEGREGPTHTWRGRYIVSVSPNNQLTIQETTYGAGGRL